MYEVTLTTHTHCCSLHKFSLEKQSRAFIRKGQAHWRGYTLAHLRNPLHSYDAASYQILEEVQMSHCSRFWN